MPVNEWPGVPPAIKTLLVPVTDVKVGVTQVVQLLFSVDDRAPKWNPLDSVVWYSRKNISWLGEDADIVTVIDVAPLDEERT
jgi:hypothetical protein